MFSISAGWRGNIKWALLFAMAAYIFFPVTAKAMHITEGLLPINWVWPWYVIAFVFVAVGILQIKKRIQENRSLMPLLGLAGAAVFLISVLPIPVPITGTSSHPAGTPLAAILVGPFASVVLGAIALLIQALFLAHGGISTWGANIVSMGIVGSFVGFGTFILLRKFRVNLLIAGFAAGMFGDWATYATTTLELSLALHGTSSFVDMFRTIIIAFIPTQLPLGILEGLLTGGVVTLLHQRRPDLLQHLSRRRIKDLSPATKGVVR